MIGLAKSHQMDILWNGISLKIMITLKDKELSMVALYKNIQRHIAQQEEHQFPKLKVAGSTPVMPIVKK